jgi:cell division inhibitor SulA/protein ImuA
MDLPELPNWNDLRAHVWRGDGARSSRATLATGFAPLDRYLPGGGWPLGALVEVFVERYGIGELALLIPALVALTRDEPSSGERRAARKWVVWISPPFVPYAPALQQRSVGIDSLLIVQPRSRMKDSLWTVEQVIRSGSSSGVLAWLAAADDVALRRLQLAAEEQSCWTVLFRPLAAQRERSPAALRIGLEQDGSATRVRIHKCRGAMPAVVDITDSLSPHGAVGNDDREVREPGSVGATSTNGATG